MCQCAIPESGEGYPVHTAVNGADALRHLETLEPALVVLDMRMPVLDGWGVARSLESQGRRLPLLVMTAAQDAQRWAAEVGAAGYIAKPFDLLAFLEAVERVYGEAVSGPAGWSWPQQARFSRDVSRCSAGCSLSGAR